MEDNKEYKEPISKNNEYKLTEEEKETLDKLAKISDNYLKHYEEAVKRVEIENTLKEKTYKSINE